MGNSRPAWIDNLAFTAAVKIANRALTLRDKFSRRAARTQLEDQFCLRISTYSIPSGKQVLEAVFVSPPKASVRAVTTALPGPDDNWWLIEVSTAGHAWFAWPAVSCRQFTVNVNVVVAVVLAESLPLPEIVKVYVPAVVPGWSVDVPPLPPLPPQAVRLLRTVMARTMPRIDRQLRRALGTPRRINRAKKVPPPAPGHRPPLSGFGINMALVAGVVFTVKLAVPLVAPELRFTVGFPRQVGRFIAPVGDEVNAHERVTVPA